VKRGFHLHRPRLRCASRGEVSQRNKNAWNARKDTTALQHFRASICFN
jgi:hypothetical protein